jgi:rhamnose utilization protein RhaD (predicted bifunctional aldolase and dehydrogenase)/NAD(P)-dependent dehydrogenase (short-subunit alcohol dehydrogenase family)
MQIQKCIRTKKVNVESSWNAEEAKQLGNDPLKLRVYTSRLLGKEEDLVLHGGGNTSVKTVEKNLFGEEEEILYVKGSGWDLATIEEAGFAPVKLKPLRQMAELDKLNDLEMVKYQRAAMTNPSAPTPSVEAILHAIIPFKFVDHTHADAIVTISNTLEGEKRLRELYGEKSLIVPYVMPGFILAKQIYGLTKALNWDKIESIILQHHGVFTFHDNPRISYERMIEMVTRAEDYLKEHAVVENVKPTAREIDPLEVAVLRRNVSGVWGKPVLAHLDSTEACIAFSNERGLVEIANRGPLTPDHIIRTKRIPVILSDNHEADLRVFTQQYENYFNEFNTGNLRSLDKAPRWAVWPGHGTIAFGSSMKDIQIVQDISRHTMKAILQAEKLDRWTTLSKKDLFEMEYWVLEQEKLKKGSSAGSMQGRVALVTGASSGIGKACVDKLIAEGAVVAALDINPSITTRFERKEILGIVCDVTDDVQLKKTIRETILHFGGLDMLITNAGVFPKSLRISEMDNAIWSKSLDINMTSHQKLLTLSLPYLMLGINPAVVIVGSKNVGAPGPGASAYSVAKAGLTQLGRVAAMELGEKGIRVNMLHPNAVFDTGIWTEEVLETRARHYGLTVEAYKRNNMLHVEVTSKDVAEMAVLMLGPAFSKTTGAQIPVDGGNERII